MSRTQSFLASSLLLIVGLLLSACDTNTPLVDEDPVTSQSLELSGGLAASFQPPAANFRSWARPSTRDGERYLDLYIQSRHEDGEAVEQVDLSLIVPVEAGEGLLPAPGTYRFESDDLVEARVQYRDEGSGTSQYSRFLLDGTRLTLRIDEAGADRLMGRFALEAAQVDGERMLDGVVEDVTLEREVRIEVVFDIDDVRSAEDDAS
jgi:hypothetical protein